MSTMTSPIRPVNPMAAEGKDTVMAVLRRDQEKFFRLAEDSKNWNVQTRCTEWEVRDLVGHMIDVTEGYLSRWDIAKRGDTAGALGLVVMGETLNDHALDFRKLSRDEALARLKADRDKMMSIFDALTPEEWTSFLVTHPYMGPVPAGFYPAFHIMMQYTVDQEAAKGVDVVYGMEVSGGWGGKWRVTVKDGQWSAQPEEGDFKGCDAVFKYTPSDFVLTVFGRFEGGSATGDPAAIQAVRRLFFRF